MIKKKSHVRKYSRKVKNKKVNYSRKVLIGGSLLAPPPYKMSSALQPRKSQRQPLKITINTPFEKKIMELYEFSKLEEIKDYISQIFRKFKYSYAQTNPAYKETDSILYLKKDEVDKEINPTEVFKVYAPSNQSISIEYNDDKKFKDIGKFYEITPLELSVDTMQLAVNTGKLEISNDKDGNSYLGFVDFPSLVITEKPSGTGFSYSSRKNATWISVYEQEFEDKDKVFDLIETIDGRHIEQTTFDSEIETIDVKISKLDKDKNSSKISKISKLENSKPTKQRDVPMTNEALFIKKQDEMRILLSDIEISSDEKEKKKQKIEEQVKYRAYVNIEEDGDGSNKNVITEDISWAMKNSLWLEKYLKIKTEDNSLTAQELKTHIDKAYDCDLSGLDEKYLIVEEFENKVENGGDGETYIICGYPDKQMKEIILNFWQDEKMRAEFDKVHEDQKTTNNEWFINLFNAYKKTKYNKSQLYKLYISIREINLTYLKNRYTEIYKSNQLDLEYQKFLKNFDNNINTYFQLIAEKYLPKLLTQIKYVFLSYKKANSNNLIPFIFNIKEVNKSHQSILKKIERLIKHVLPYRFSIIDYDEYNKTGKGKDKDSGFDDEYKLWYSRYRYGKFFHIKTEYLHTISNISDKAHNYKNSITLEELIYSCYLGYDPSNKDFTEGSLNILLPQKIHYTYFEKLKLSYEIRKHLLNKTKKQVDKKVFKEVDKQINKKNIKDCKLISGINRSEKVFCLYENDKLEKSKNKLKTVFYNKNNQKIYKDNKEYLNIFTKENYNSIKFILMIKTHHQEYHFVYIYKGIFYKLSIESNIYNILDEIINEINNIHKDIKNNNIIKFTENSKVYKVISNDILNEYDYKYIFEYCPYILKHMINNNELKTDVSYYYKNELLNIDNILNYNRINLPNLFKTTKPYLYENFISSTKYIETYTSFNKNNKLINSNCEVINYEEAFANTSCDMHICNPNDVTINCVFLNLDNCGYDIIEIIANDESKIVLFIIPSKIKTHKYLGNFLDLDETSIPMLKAIKKKYVNNNYLCFIHHTIILRYYTFHLHICPASNYKRIFPKYESGQFMLQDIFIDEIINNLESNKKFYFSLNYNIIRVQ